MDGEKDPLPSRITSGPRLTLCAWAQWLSGFTIYPPGNQAERVGNVTGVARNRRKEQGAESWPSLYGLIQFVAA